MAGLEASSEDCTALSLTSSQRRLKAIAQRKLLTTPKSKPAKSTGGSPTKAKKLKTSPSKASPSKTKKASPKDDFVLFAPRVSGPTSEKIPRSELTAKAWLEGVLVRVHVATLNLQVWGQAFHTDACAISKAIEKGGMTKNDCLQMKASLQK